MMKEWTPQAIWDGLPCYIIGGGPSLEGFDWKSLQGKKVIGCNAACYLGPRVAPIVVFGDSRFLPQHRPALESYVEHGGWVVSSASAFIKPKDRPKWLKWMPRQMKGLGTDALGYNGNTGAMALNLALLLGASTVYLLGYDMQPRNGRGNFHFAYGNGNTRQESYERFKKGMAGLAEDLPRVFPGRQVINLEDGTSALDVFPKESLHRHFERTADDVQE